MWKKIKKWFSKEKPKKITEEMGIQEKWYKEAKEINIEELPEFIRKLTENYSHDYGTICHAVTAGALASAWAINNSPTGGITGFQASIIMWQFIKKWMHYKDEPMRLIKYQEMLYPQYDYKFKTISEDTWKWIQNEAEKSLKNKENVHPNVKKHWQSIVDGKVPFGYKVEG